MEGEEGEGEEGDEAVDGVGLLRGEDPPPPDGAVAEEEGEVEGHHGLNHLVYVSPCYHLSFCILFFL